MSRHLILVAGLVARPGEILIVENPEAHLHPLAQSRMGEFLARVSQAGVQVFVESHSEHILNAFRLAVKDKWIENEALSVLYFRRHEVDPILRIMVDSDGRIEDWPKDFFDQRTREFLKLFGE
jgi:predicted ATPase